MGQTLNNSSTPVVIITWVWNGGMFGGYFVKANDSASHTTARIRKAATV